MTEPIDNLALPPAIADTLAALAARVHVTARKAGSFAAAVLYVTVNDDVMATGGLSSAERSSLASAGFTGGDRIYVTYISEPETSVHAEDGHNDVTVTISEQVPIGHAAYGTASTAPALVVNDACCMPSLGKNHDDCCVACFNMQPAARVWTDASCLDGSGIGILILRGTQCQERRERITSRCSTTAELFGICRAVELCASDESVVIHCDSMNAVDLAVGSNRPSETATRQSVVTLRHIQEQILDITSRRTGVKIVYVKGHGTDYGNHRADHLAYCALTGTEPTPRSMHLRRLVNASKFLPGANGYRETDILSQPLGAIAKRR